MSTLAYPSADFPGQPSVALEVPDGWEPAHAPGTTMAPDSRARARSHPTSS